MKRGVSLFIACTTAILMTGCTGENHPGETTMSDTSLFSSTLSDAQENTEKTAGVFDNLVRHWNARTYLTEEGTNLPFQIYMPENYDESRLYPFILYMHSAGVKCDDNSHIYKGEAKFLRNLEKSAYKDDAIILAPCCPEGEKWVPAETWKQITYDFVNTEPTTYMKAVTELLGVVREQFSIDDDRLYLYGMSMGGFAVWDLLTRNPDMFAAAIPVAGAGDPSAVAEISGTAIWIFHGAEDKTVPKESADRMFEALKAAGREDIQYTVFEGQGHGIWALTANTEGLLDWLFSQKRTQA